MTGMALDPQDMARRVQAYVAGERRVAPCCDNPPHAGPCDATSHRYRQLPQMRPATDVEIRVAAEEGQGGLVQLIKRQIAAEAKENGLEAKA